MTRVNNGSARAILARMSTNPESDRDEAQKLHDRITIAAFELNLMLRAAHLLGVHVHVDTAERKDAASGGDYTEIILTRLDEGTEP